MSLKFVTKSHPNRKTCLLLFCYLFIFSKLTSLIQIQIDTNLKIAKKCWWNKSINKGVSESNENTFKDWHNFKSHLYGKLYHDILY